MLQMFRYCVPA